MKFKVMDLVLPKKDCITVYATGYYGDMDHDYVHSDSYRDNDSSFMDLNCALIDAVVHTRLLRENNSGLNQLETGSEMHDWLEEHGLDGIDLVPSDNTHGCDYLPTVEYLTIIQHDENGVGRHLTISGFPKGH